MLSPNRRLLLFVAMGLSDIIMSLVFLLLFGRTVTLVCRREPQHIVCEQRSTLFGWIVTGPKTLSRVRGAQLGESEGEDGTTYRVELLTDQGVEPFSGWYTSNYKQQRELADQINAFVGDAQRQSTLIEYKPEVWVLIAISSFGAIGLGVMLVGPLAAALRRIRDNAFRGAILMLLAVIATLLMVQCKPTPVHIINTVVVERIVLVYVTPTLSTLPFHSSIIPPPTATPQPLPTWTKTQVTATHTATPTRTPLPGTPTPTNTPKPSRTRIPEILGFTDQVIEQLEQKEYHLVDQEKTTANGHDYVAYRFNAPIEYQDRVLLIYRMQESEPTLLFNSGLGLYPVPIAINEWGDINSDGQPDLLIQYSTLGNGWCATWYDSLQINQDGDLSDILPIHIHDIQDLNNDGVKELIFRDCRGEMYASAHVWGVASFRVYAWNNDMHGVRDVSAQFLKQYDESVENRIKAVEESYSKDINAGVVQNYMAEAFGLLLDYENSWRRDEGWQVYWGLTDPANWTKLDQAGYDVIAHLRNRHKEQYEIGEAFR